MYNLSKCIFPKCVFSKCIFPKCIFQSVFFQSVFIQSVLLRKVPDRFRLHLVRHFATLAAQETQAVIQGDIFYLQDTSMNRKRCPEIMYSCNITDVLQCHWQDPKVSKIPKVVKNCTAHNSVSLLNGYYWKGQ